MYNYPETLWQECGERGPSDLEINCTERSGF